MSNTLAQLRDIHFPSELSHWLLTPFWYVLFGLLIVSAVLLLFLFYQRYEKRRPIKEALRLLDAIQTQHQKNPDSQRASAEIVMLLKRVALACYPRVDVASLRGSPWLVFLNETSRALDFNQVEVALLTVPYRRASDYDLQPLFHLTRKWILQRRRHV